MTGVLLDTSAYSGFMRGFNPMVRAVRTAGELVFTPIVLGELRAGFRRGKRAVENEQQLQEFLASPRVRVIALDAATSERYAAILSNLLDRGTPIPTNDLWIAASAMQFGLRVLTADAHFSHVQQILVEYIDVATA